MRASSCAYRGRTWIGALSFFGIGAALVSLAGCQPPTAATEWPARETVGELRIGEPVKHENLTIFPVYSRAAKNDDRFITLDEGLKAGTVEIMETGAVEASTGAAQSNPDGIIDEGESVVATETAPDASEAVAEAVEDAVLPLQVEDLFGDVLRALRSRITDAPVVQSPTPEDLFGDNSDSSVSGDVNQLMVVNRSDKPLYLMPGEVIIGGKQDRTIGQEIVIAPTKKPVAIDAFCVEHGRWNDRGAEGLAMLASDTVALHTWIEAASDTIDTTSEQPASAGEVSTRALAEVAAKADQGKFVAPAGTLSSKVRFSVVGSRAQGEVWDEVAKVNAATKNSKTAETGGFTGNYFDPEVLKKIEPYVAKLNDPVAETDRVVGVIVAIDGKFATLDVFESTPLFAKLWPKLLKSYALDAAIAQLEKAEAEQGDAERAKPATVKVLKIADARAFLADALHSSAQETTTEDGIVMTKREGQYCVSFSAHREEQLPFVTSVIPVVDVPHGAAYGGNLGVSSGAGVHTSAFGK